MTVSLIPKGTRPGERLLLLGGFELQVAHERGSLPIGTKRLLAFLALQERPLQRVYVAARLWLDASEERSRANLRSALWRLPRPGFPLIRSENGHLSLDPRLAVDVREVVQQAHRLIAPGEGTEDDLDPRPLLRDLLPDWYDDWVLAEQERVRQLRLHALEAMAHRLAALGRFGQAVEAALAAVRGEPLRESAHRTLIQVHLAHGNRAQAVLHYQRLEQLLRREIGAAPTFRVGELGEILHGDALATRS